MAVNGVKTNVTSGSIIRKLRKESGLTQAQLSKHGQKNEICSERHLRRIENGDTEPTPFILNKILKVLGVSSSDFARMLDDDESVTEFLYEMSSIWSLALDARYEEAAEILEKLKANDKYDKNNPKIAQSILMYEGSVVKNFHNNYELSAKMLYEGICLTVPSAKSKDDEGSLNYSVIARRSCSWIEYRMLLLLANSNCELGNLEGALDICDAVMKSLNRKETDGDIRSRLRPVVFFNLSEVYLKKGFYEEALEASSMGIAEYKYVFIERLLQSKAKALYCMNNTKDAATAFRQAHEVFKLQQRGNLAEIFKNEVAEKYQIIIE